MSPSTWSGRVRGRPGPGRGTRIRCRTGIICGESPAWPTVSRNASTCRYASQARWIPGGSWSTSHPGTGPGHGRPAPPRDAHGCRGERPRRAHERGRWWNPPRHPNQPCRQHRPQRSATARYVPRRRAAASTRTTQRSIDAPPRAVPVGHVAPRATHPNPEPHTVNQPAQRPPARSTSPSGPLAGRQQRLQDRPLCIGQIMTGSGVYGGHEASGGDVVA